MRKSLLKPGTSFNPSSSFKSSTGEFSRGRPSERELKEGKAGNSRSSRKVSRSRSRSPMIRKSNTSARDQGPMSRDRDYAKGRSVSRDRPPRNKPSAGIGLIAQAREQMRLAQSGKLRMDSPSREFRAAPSSGRDGHHGHDVRDRERGELRKSLQDRIGEKKNTASGVILKRNSNSVFADLDRAVKKVREERSGATSGHWNKKNIAPEDKNTDRWGHSGYEEMYRQDMKSSSSSSREHVRADLTRRSRSRSRSRTPRRGRKSDSRNAAHELKQKPTGTRRSRSLLRSPSRKARPLMTRSDGSRRISPLLSRKPETFVAIKKPVGQRSSFQDARKYSDVKASREDARVGNGSSRSHNRPSSSRHQLPNRNDTRTSNTLSSSRAGKSLKSVIQQSKPRSRIVPKSEVSGRGRPAERRSFSGSMSDSSRTPSPQLKRPNTMKMDLKGRKRLSTRSRSRSKSNARSSSSQSSSDEDVLELHPRGGRRKSGSLSRTSRSSSSGESNSAESVDEESQKRKSGSSSSSSSSSGSESEDVESDKHSVAMAKDKDRTRAQHVPATTPAKTLAETGVNPTKKVLPPVKRSDTSAKDKKQTSDIDSDSSGPAVVVEKVAPKSTIVSAQKAAAKPSPSKAAKVVSSTVCVSSKKKTESALAPISTSKKTAPVKAKEPANVASAESESESESSSESDDEPRMTLSERFAKLTQMSTDKREFSKPEISASDIDTKLKVVKDLRNADTKVYVNGITPRERERERIRPKSPEHGEGETRYSSDDRRKHFERMTRDEPRERPVDWSDVRVRYSYYKDRGYFNDRPLSLDEYVKWEAWWYEYRDWLEGEGYYGQVMNPNSEPQYEEQDEREVRTSWGHPRDEHHQGGSGSRSLVSAHRRIIAPPEPLMARPISFGGRRGHNPRRHPQDMSPPPMGSFHVPISRRIGHSAGGSLVVNIRQGNYNNSNNRGRGRLAGRIGVRRN